MCHHVLSIQASSPRTAGGKCQPNLLLMGATPALLEKAVFPTKGQIICVVNVYSFLGDSKQICILKSLENPAIKILSKLCLT